MAKTSDYLQGLVTQRNNLADILIDRGIEASKTEKFNTLIPKINSIATGQVAGIDKKLYSFGLLSDVHLKDTSMGQSNTNDSVAKFKRALNFYKDQSVEFVSIAGDLLAHNSRYPSEENPLTSEEIKEAEKIWLNEVLLYRDTVAEFSDLQIYEINGNHDVWALGHYEQVSNVGAGYKITVNDSGYQDFTGKTCEQIWKEEINELNYVIEKGESVYIYFSMYYWNYLDFVRPQDIQWLTQKLNQYSDKRVYLVAHMPVKHMFDELSTPTGLSQVNNTTGKDFKQLLQTHPNVIHISGHLHYELDQEGQAGFINPNTHIFPGGATVIKCSSGAYTRRVGVPYVNVPEGSQGYIVDVYEDKTVFRGIDFSGDPKLIDKANYVVTV